MPEAAVDQGVALRLAAAMFVLVVDTSLMNVSISAVVKDLGTTVSGVQSSIALEALVSAAFILIGSKIGDLVGRKRAFVVGLLGYAVGAIAMTLAQSLVPVIIFWAVIGGIGASLLLPSMQSLIHGNFSGTAQKKVYALVGASAAIAAAVGPLLGGFITTFLSWRVGFALEVVVIAVVLSGMGRIKDVPYTGRARWTGWGPRCRSRAWVASSSASSSGRRAARRSALLLAVGALGLLGLAFWLRRRQRAGKAALIDPRLFVSKLFRYGISGQLLQQVALGGTMIALPIFLQMVLEYNALQAGLSLAPLSLSMFAVALLAGRRAGRRRASSVIRAGFAIYTLGILLILPLVPRATSGWYLTIPLAISGVGLGLLVSQLNNYTLAPISQERVSEAAGVNSAAGSFGLSFGLAFAGAIMLATLSILFTQLTQASTVLSGPEKEQVVSALENDAELLSNTQLVEVLAGQPKPVQDEIVRINTEARPRALQIALLVPLLAGLGGLAVSFRMRRQPEPEPVGDVEGMMLG